MDQTVNVIVDLSHPLEPGMPSYPGLPMPKFNVVMAHDDPATQTKYAPGTTFQIASYELGGNTGTYLDAPFHRHPDGLDLRDLPLERMVNLPGVLVNAADNGAIGAEAFRDMPVAGAAVLVRTGWSERWADAADYFRSGPFLMREACEYLVTQRAALVGIDSANIDDMRDRSRPAHTVLLKAGIPIVEHLTNLAELEGKHFRFFAAPPAIAEGTSFVVRAFAVCD
jgi:kynurenine formamidase